MGCEPVEHRTFRLAEMRSGFRPHTIDTNDFKKIAG
jgi:hypothetical protein